METRSELNYRTLFGAFFLFMVVLVLPMGSLIWVSQMNRVVESHVDQMLNQRFPAFRRLTEMSGDLVTLRETFLEAAIDHDPEALERAGQQARQMELDFRELRGSLVELESIGITPQLLDDISSSIAISKALVAGTSTDTADERLDELSNLSLRIYEDLIEIRFRADTSQSDFLSQLDQRAQTAQRRVLTTYAIAFTLGMVVSFLFSWRLASKERELSGFNQRLETQAVQLREAAEAAVEASEAKSRFLANMSHEIRTPMNGIMGCAQLIAQTELDHNQKEYLHILNTSADSLLLILNDILDIAKIEAGKLNLDQAEYVISECLKNVIQFFLPKARESELSLELFMTPEMNQPVVGDVSRLRQVLLNLVGNALKFTHEGGVEVRAFVETDVSARYVCFEIKDTGIGIPKDKLHVLFKPFSQVDDSGTRVYGGTGLGLAISRELVEAMGGQVGVESHFGEGSTFSFRLPYEPLTGKDQLQSVFLTQDAVSLTNTLDLPTPLPEPVVHRVKPPALDQDVDYDILLVEDHPANWKVTLTMLEKRGYQCHAVESGQKALDVLGEKRFRLVLMDCQMPGMDGYETTRHIRGDSRQNRIPIVALTAKAMKEDRDLCLQAGMDDYLTKPIKARILFETIEKYLT